MSAVGRSLFLRAAYFSYALPRIAIVSHAAVTLSLIGALAYMYFSKASAPVIRFEIAPPEKVSFVSPQGVVLGANSGTISPDGRRVVFTASDASGNVQSEAVDAEATFSPDGHYFAYASNETGRLSLRSTVSGDRIALADLERRRTPAHMAARRQRALLCYRRPEAFCNRRSNESIIRSQRSEVSV